MLTTARHVLARRLDIAGCSRLSSRLASTSAAAIDKRKAYSATLLLPKTPVPLKHKKPAQIEEALRARTTDELYRRQSSSNTGPLFVFHDGPPYANGHLHMGHALNKVLKDIVNRFKVIRGHRVHYVPGWDCHGLPIEHKALADLGKSHTALTPESVRESARKYALEAIDVQKNELRSLGIMADWDGEKGVYRTLDHDFEIRQLRVFQKMVEKGFITHRLRPTYYSPSSRTALAEAELSYQDLKTESVYVAFPVERKDMAVPLRDIYDKAQQVGAHGKLSLAIWTTTPWSLAGNSGVMVGEDIMYCVVSNLKGELLVVAEERLEQLREPFGGLQAIGRLSGRELSGTRYTHTFHPPSSPIARPAVITSRHVTSDSGTGLVHSAPAHGKEDYEAFVAAGSLPETLRCPIDDDGRFTAELSAWADRETANSLIGKEVLGDGSRAMIEILRGSGVLLAQETIAHRYPCDWKTKEPILIRATPQWFADVEALKPLAVKALDGVSFYPPTGKTRLLATVMSRSEWCISRQRSWGVPIPVLFDAQGEPLLSAESLAHVISVLKRTGTDHWWTGPVEDFIPASHRGQKMSRGFDTLDVWFDSGSSWALLDNLGRGRAEPLADVYLEGSDQHRGWFQSSLLTRLSSLGSDAPVAPYANVVTHGFVMDEQGDKMSKSKGNGVSPMDVIFGAGKEPGYGADTLRVWASGVDYSRDVSIGPSSISHAAESLRKLRSTLRFMLANTTAGGAPLMQDVSLSLVDQHVLQQLHELRQVALEGYEAFAFNRVMQATSAFASATLSTLYFDTVKDALYCDAAIAPSRQAIVATLDYTLRSLLQIIAPIVPHLAEEMYQHMADHEASVFLDTWTDKASPHAENVKSQMAVLLAVRTRVQALVEQARAEKRLRSASEVEVDIRADGRMAASLREQRDILPALLGVSAVHFADSLPDVSPAWQLETTVSTDGGDVAVTVRPASGHQCPRCWLHTSLRDDALCDRCSKVVT